MYFMILIYVELSKMISIKSRIENELKYHHYISNNGIFPLKN